jgi:hypothetical protein
LLLLAFWPAKILRPSRALTAGAKEKFYRRELVLGAITSSNWYSRVEEQAPGGNTDVEWEY